MEERQLQLMDDFALPRILEQLERMDFYNYECSPLLMEDAGLVKQPHYPVIQIILLFILVQVQL